MPGVQTAATIQIISWTIIEIRHGPVARYSNHQEIINRRPEQLYTSSDTRLEWPREAPLFDLDSNKRRGPKWDHFKSHPKPSLKSGLLPLERYGTCHETISGRLIPHLTQGWNGLGRGHYRNRSRINARDPNCGYYQVISGPLLKSCLGLLFRYGTH